MPGKTPKADPAPLTGPADTHGPDVQVQSVPPDHGAAIDAGLGTAPATAVRQGGRPSSPQHTARASRGRTESYTTTKPNGTEVKVTRDLDTGEATYEDA